jgi:hypothetical protein
VKFNGSSTLVCPACNESVHVGFGGEKNLAIHHTSKACKNKSQQRNKCSKVSKNQDLHTFFKPCAPLNLLTVTALPMVHAMVHARIHVEETLDETTCDHSAPSSSLEISTESAETMEIVEMVRLSPCPRGIELLSRLEAAAMCIPVDIPLATSDHLLSSFAADPQTCVSSPEEDDWIVLNAMMKASFGWGELEMRDNVKLMLNRGNHRLDGFIQFFKYFVLERGLEGVMIETKVDALLHELNNR